MAEITYFNLADAAERSLSDINFGEVTQRTINWSDLTTAGFAAGDVVFIIWNFSLGGSDTTTNNLAEISHGTTFAGRTSFLSTDIRVEAQDTTSLVGHRHLGWVEEHTLVVNENFYFALRVARSGDSARSANFSVTFLKQADLAADDYRYDAQANALAVTTTFQTDATVTLPSSGGDDWLILGTGYWDVGSISVNLEQQLQVNGTEPFHKISLEGEDDNEQLPLANVYYYDNAAASAVVNLRVREDSSSSFVLDESRLLCLRLNAFADYIGLHDTTTDTLSTTPGTWVETGTVSLSLSATGNVFVVGQSVMDAASTANDPRIRLQENNTDIVANMGFASDHARDATDFIGVWVHVVESMISGTKTIDMDVTQAESTTAADIEERSLVAFSMELASTGGQTVIVNQVSETDTVQPVKASPGAVSVSVGLVSETDSIFIVTPSITGAPQSVTVNLISETDTVFDVKVVPGALNIPVGLSEETDTVFEVKIVPGALSIPIGTTEETDGVAPVFPVVEGGPQTVLVLNVAEIDTVFPVTPILATLGGRNQEEDFFIGVRIGI